MAVDVQKLEDRIDRVAAGAMEVSLGFGGVKFQNLTEIMEFAKIMAVSHSAVPPHLRGEPGDCLAICTTAARFGFDPFQLAAHSFAMKKSIDVTVENPNGGRTTQKQEVTTIAYDSYFIRAVIEAFAPIKGRMKYTYSGEGLERRCLVSAVLRETNETVSMESPTLGERLKAIGKSDKGYIKGSPLWETKPDQQLGYDTARDFCRRYFPEVLMGFYDKDELEEAVRAETATDITPKPDIAKRLTGGKKKRGFDGDHVESEIGDGVPTSRGEKAAGDKSQNAPTPAPATVPDQGVPPSDTPTQAGQSAQPGPDPKPIKVETALERGKRLLIQCATARDVADLRDSIGDELTDDQKEKWSAHCDARMKDFPTVEGTAT